MWRHSKYQPQSKAQKKRRQEKRRRSRLKRGRTYCVICHSGTESGPLFSPCKCRGNNGRYHFHCLKLWIIQNADEPCTVCKAFFVHRNIHPYMANRPFWERLSIVLFRPQEEDLTIPIRPFLLALLSVLLPVYIMFPYVMMTRPAILAVLINFVLVCAASLYTPMSMLNEGYPHRYLRFGAYVYDKVYYPESNLDVTVRAKELQGEREQVLLQAALEQIAAEDQEQQVDLEGALQQIDEDFAFLEDEDLAFFEDEEFDEELDPEFLPED